MFKLLYSSIFLVLTLIPLISEAEDIVMSIKITQPEIAMSKNYAAYGVLIGPNKFEKRPAKEVIRVGEQSVDVVFEVDEGEVSSQNTFLSAVIEFTINKGSDSKKVYSFFADITSPKAQSPKSEKPCVFKTSISKELTNSESYLASLIELRAAQKEILHQRFIVRLTEAKIKHLQGLERLFGLGDGQPIDPNSNPFELYHRIFRIRNAIKNSVNADMNNIK
jgi:hypothetical protein